MAATTNRYLKYSYEALGLGLFMFSAGFFDVIIDYPGFYIHQHVGSDVVRRFLIGLTMGLTALFIFTSSFGKASGAYINPSVTLVRYWLHDINLRDSMLYMISQFAGGAIGMYLVALVFPREIKDPIVNYIVTKPKGGDLALAFILEFAISALLIAVVLVTGTRKEWARYTPYIVATLIALYITFEAPYTGMSMNPARTFASAVVAGQWDAFWLYCLAPTLGMLSVGAVFKIKQLKSNR